MKVSEKLKLLASTRILSGVSFESIIKLDKRYGARFEKMTLGFECEIAVGDLDVSDDGEGQIDLDSLRESFSESFSYSEQQFLDTLEINEDFMDTYSIDTKYGEIPESFLSDIDSTIQQLEALHFTVAYNPATPNLLFTPDVSQPGVMRDFSYSEANVDFKKAAELGVQARKIFKAFADKYKINLGNNGYYNLTGQIGQTINAIYTFLKDILDYKKSGKPLTNDADADQEELDTIEPLKRSVWLVGYHLRKLENQLYKLRTASLNVDLSSGIMLVLNPNGGMESINLNKYSEDGLLSPYIAFDDAQFEADYREAEDNERDRQWEAEIEEARSQSNQSANGPLEAIYRLVVDSVDSEAHLAEQYHGAGIAKGRTTVVEPDSSIEPAGAEVVSRVYTGPTEALNWLEKVFNMIDDNYMETNSSTGLHVNIGTFKPIDTSYRGQPGYIDVVKLAILSGDDYLLKQFKRQDNEYARPMLSDLNRLAETATIDFRNEKFIDIVTELNGLFIRSHSDRYRTINIANLVRHNYLEFRIAGNRNYHADFNKVKKAVYRYMQLCAIASDPQAHFKEYVRELYRFFGPEEEVVRKQPLAKTAEEASYILREWANGKGLYSALLLKNLTDAINRNQEIDTIDFMATVIAMIPAQKLSLVTFPVLHAFRLILLYSVRKRPDPKTYLMNVYKNNPASVLESKLGAMFRLKPSFIRYIFTGQSSAKPQGL